MSRKVTDYLMDEYPTVVLPSLAVAVGINEAIILQQIHYWLKNNEAANRNFRNGYYWTYGTYAEWQKQFPWLSEITVKRVFLSLEKAGFIISDYFNASKMDRTKWYRIDYDKLGAAMIAYQNDTMNNTNLIRYTYTETNTETNNGIMAQGVNAALRTTDVKKKKHHKATRSDPDISEFIGWYIDYYAQIKGAPHPLLKSAQKVKVHNKLKDFSDEWDLDQCDLKDMAEAFFNEPISDHNINHFATEGILQNRFYEAVY